MSWLSNIAPVLGTGLGALFAAPTGGMSLGMGALIGGMAGSGVSSAMAADEANNTNVDLTRETNSAQIELANTAHQREIRDLAAAGLNPILSSKYGGSATPGLTAPQVQSLAPIIQSSAFGVRDAALSTANLQADIELKRASTLNSSAQAISNGQDARRKAMENDVIEKETALEKWKLGERNKSRGWELFLDDAKRGINTFNPFRGIDVNKMGHY